MTVFIDYPYISTTKSNGHKMYFRTIVCCDLVCICNCLFYPQGGRLLPHFTETLSEPLTTLVIQHPTPED